MNADIATIQALRSDLALQIARHVERSGRSQSAMARQLDVPPSTLSKIVRGQVHTLSLERLIRIAVRARLPVVLQTGTDPAEAGVYVSGNFSPPRPHRSTLADRARESRAAQLMRLAPSERLEAQRRHNELMTALQAAGQRARHTTGK